ncbi:unnamed protein product [Rotaria sp. Silwood2]|nr:unnamed protein product [Rotaria sp. Silwood2]CAF3303936.1 unnamed protein product [Rotaria sp. Silwood2]CAF4165429.1 unnamed protein product [Rotaria sp. Silwood2]CAF4191879.1 unnamed protein product [Rotaria sp. Silwood2]
MASKAFITLKLYATELNLFKTASSDEQSFHRERLTTRIYIFSLMSLLIIVGIVAGSVVRTVNEIEYIPSQSKFVYLVKRYPSTLKCPCSKTGIAYETFVNTHANFHQVCSSDFVTQAWIDLVFTKMNTNLSTAYDIKNYLSFFWQVIQDFCHISNTTWISARASFGASYIVSPMAVAEDVIRKQSEEALINHISLAQTTVTRNLLTIRSTISGNKFISALATNFHLTYLPSNSENESFPKMLPREYNNCSCLTNISCPHPLLINNTDHHLVVVPGLIADCLIVDATLSSTFECYYDPTCFALLHSEFITQMKLLSINSNKHFRINMTVEMLLNELMIDEVISKITFDSFYQQCSPAHCSYSYNQRFSPLYIVTTMIGVFGILSFVLRLIIPRILSVILRWPQRNLTSADMLRNEIHSRPRFLVSEDDQIVTIDRPSLITYEKLYDQHSSTIQCPCSQLAVPYGTFSNVTFILHEVCLSDFVSSKWLNYLKLFDPNNVPTWTETDFSRDFQKEIVNETHFDLFYDQCAPATCSYRITKRRNIIVAILLLMSICGGLNRGLQILLPLICKIVFFCIDKWKTRKVVRGK